METIPIGAVEVIVIAEDGVVLNGPDHRTLGRIGIGESAVISEVYLSHLLEQGLVCLPSDFKELDMQAVNDQLKQLSDDIDDADDGDADGEQSPVAPVTPGRRGGRRPRAK